MMIHPKYIVAFIITSNVLSCSSFHVQKGEQSDDENSALVPDVYSKRTFLRFKKHTIKNGACPEGQSRIYGKCRSKTRKQYNYYDDSIPINVFGLITTETPERTTSPQRQKNKYSRRKQYDHYDDSFPTYVIGLIITTETPKHASKTTQLQSTEESILNTIGKIKWDMESDRPRLKSNVEDGARNTTHSNKSNTLSNTTQSQSIENSIRNAIERNQWNNTLSERPGLKSIEKDNAQNTTEMNKLVAVSITNKTQSIENSTLNTVAKNKWNYVSEQAKLKPIEEDVARNTTETYKVGTTNTTQSQSIEDSTYYTIESNKSDSVEHVLPDNSSSSTLLTVIKYYLILVLLFIAIISNKLCGNNRLARYYTNII